MRSFRRVLFACSFILALGFASVFADTTLYLGGLGNLYSLNETSGADAVVAQLSPEGIHIETGGMAYDPYTNHLYVTGAADSSPSITRLYLLDWMNGALTEIGPCGDGISLTSGGLAFDLQSRTLYATGWIANQPGGSHLFTVNVTTGAATSIGANSADGWTHISGLGSDPETGTLYGNGYVVYPNQSFLFSIDKVTGLASQIGSHGLTEGRQMNYGGLAFDPVTHVLYGNGSVTGGTSGLYTVNPGTGAATLVGSFSTGNNATDAGIAFVGGYPTGVDGNLPGRLSFLALPNPSQGALSFAFVLPRENKVRIEIYDVSGRRVFVSAPQTVAAGPHRIDGPGRNLSPGVYTAILRSERGILARTKLVRIR